MNMQYIDEKSKDEMSVEKEGNKLIFSGVFRAYSSRHYGFIVDEIKKLNLGKKIIIDTRKMEYMNSCGITAFSRGFFSIVDKGAKIEFVYDEDIVWQKRVFDGLNRYFKSRGC